MGRLTLSFNWDAGNRGEIAPFKYVKDATIRNLRTQGKITSSSYDSQLSGLIMNAEGNTTISGCVSEVDLKGSSSLAGILQWPDGNAHITINDCLVKGTFHATYDLEGGKNRRICGFIAHMPLESTCTLNNCLYLGTNNALDYDESSDTFCWLNGIVNTLNNCYYLNACGEAQGEKITEEQLKSGHVAYLLQNGRDTQFWGQELDKDNEPQLTADAAKRVCKVEFAYKNKVAVTRYANQGGNVKLPTAKELLGADYDAQKSYKLAFENGFSETTAINGDITVNVTVSVVTDIDGVTADKADTNTPVYDLQGRYLGISLDHLPRGIYIVGGKKVIKK